MADERVLSVAPSIVDPTPRTKPRPTRTGLGLEHVYVRSDDGVEENLVIILHGLGDTMAPFVRMARQLKLPQTSALVLQASESLPFLDEGEEMYQWYPSFTSLGELIERPNPLSGARALHRVIEHLGECGWAKERIHLFGFAQGGTVVLESALRLEGGVKSAVSVGGGLIELPTRPGPGAGTRVLYVGPKTGTAGLSKGFGNVRIEETKEVRMVQGPEWSVVMRFWSEVVERRGPEGEGRRTLGRARHRKCVSLSSANLTPHGSRVRSSAAPPASPPVRLNRRSLGVIEERASPPKLSTYAKLFSRFRRAASTDSNLPADPKPEQPGPSIKPRRTLRKRTSQQIPPTPRRDTASTSHSREQTTSNREQTTGNREPKPRPSRDVPRETVPIPTTREAVARDTVPAKEPVRRVSPVRRPTSPVPFNPPAPIPLPTPVTPPRQRQRTGTLPSDMHRPGSPNKQSLKTWWKQFKLAQPVSLKKDHDDLKNTPHTVFGIPLRESLRYASVQISTANPQGELYVWGYIPVVVAKCGLFLKENATEVEGVFRINGSSRRMRDLQAIFESPPRYGKDLNWKHESYTSHDVASVFRRYLTQMPEPVIPTEQYHNFRAALAKQPRDESEVIHIYRKLIKDMPRANQYLLLYVLDLLSVFARKSEKNLMTETNLAVIFRPGIISHPTHEMQPQEHALSQEVLVFLIQHQDHFMLDPPARGDSIMLSSGNTPGLSPNRADFSPPAAERTGYIVPSDSDEDPPPGGYKLVERRRDPSGLVRRRSLNDPGVTATLTTEPESIGSDSPVSGSIEGGKVKRSRTAPSQRGATLDKRRVKRLDTLGSVGSAQEAGIIEKERVVKDEPDRDAPTPTSTTAVVNS